MPQSLAQIYLHLVFSTKNRAQQFRKRTILENAHAYLAGTCNNLDCPALIVGGVEDHVHILCRLGRKQLGGWCTDQHRHFAPGQAR